MTVYEYAKAAVWLAGLVFGGLTITHKVVRADFSARFGKELASYNLTTAVHRWPSHFVELFDSVFGNNHWSLFCIRRSCYCSLAGLGAVSMMFFVLAPFSFLGFVSDDAFVRTYFIGLLSAPAFNMVVDYCSLLETRWLIGRLAGNPSLKKSVGALFLDVILTVIIYAVWAASYIVFVSILQNYVYGKNYSSIEFFREWCGVVHTLPPGNSNSLMHLTFYTTFLTSVWLWMLGGSVITAKILGSLGGSPWRWLSRSFLDMETKPLQSLGWIAGASVLFVALVCLPVLLITGTVEWNAAQTVLDATGNIPK